MSSHRLALQEVTVDLPAIMLLDGLQRTQCQKMAAAMQCDQGHLLAVCLGIWCPAGAQGMSKESTLAECCTSWEEGASIRVEAALWAALPWSCTPLNALSGSHCLPALQEQALSEGP